MTSADGTTERDRSPRVDHDGVIVAVEVGDDGLVLTHPAGDRSGPASLPAGSCAAGESPESGAVRLVREQTGLEVRVEAEVVTFVQEGTPAGTMLAHGYRAVPVGGTLVEVGSAGPVGVYRVSELPPAVPARVAVRRVLAEYLMGRATGG